MSVNITNHTPQLVADKRSQIGIFLRQMVDGIDRASIPKTPYRHGDLARNKLKQVLGTHGTIVWRQQYARILEDKQFAHYTTPGTGPHYAQNAVRSEVARAGIYAKQAGLI